MTEGAQGAWTRRALLSRLAEGVAAGAASLGGEPTLVWLGCDARWLAGGT